MRYFDIDETNWPGGVSDGLLLPCAICGNRHLKFDYVVEDMFWDTVVPIEYKRDVVCLSCLDKLSKECGNDLASNLISLQFVGAGFTIELIPVNVFRWKERRNE
jgi:hypothetical protein